MESTFLYHVGGNGLYSNIDYLNKNFDIQKKDTTEVQIWMHINKLFANETDTLHLAFENLTHTSDNLPLANKVREMYSNVFEAK